MRKLQEVVDSLLEVTDRLLEVIVTICVWLLVALGVVFILSDVCHAQPLEVKLAEATPDGPRLTLNDGCFIYGSLVAAISQDYTDGVQLKYQLQRIEAVPETVPGMKRFVLLTFTQIYAARKVDHSFESVRQTHIDMCRQYNGETWRFPAIMDGAHKY